MNPWRHRLRRLRFAAGAVIAALLIVAAVLVGLMQLLLPLAARYPDRLAQFASSRLHRSVHFDRVRGQWQPSGPLLSVRGLTLGPAYPGGASITLPHAAIKFDFAAWLKPAHRWVTLRVTGLEVRVLHDKKGWHVLGLGNPNEPQQTPLQSLPVDLDMHVLKVSIMDAVANKSYVLFSPHLRVVSVGDNLRFGGSIVRQGSPQPLTVIGSFNPVAQNADLYVAGTDLDLATMARDVNLQGYGVRNGRGNLEMWGDWRGDHLKTVATRFDLSGLSLTTPDAHRADLAAIAGVARLRKLADGWGASYRRSGKERDDIDDVGGALLRVRGTDSARTLTLAARNLDIAPLLSIASLMPQAPASAGAWIAVAKPHGTVDSAALSWNADGRYAVVAHLRDLGASPAAGFPGVDKLAGSLRGDQEALAFDVPQQAVTLRYPHVFREPFELAKFGGRFAAWRDGTAWHVAADSLMFDNDQFGGAARGEMVLRGDGSKPFVDASAIITHAQVPAAKLFWPVNSMPRSTVQWLNRALIAGKVDDGRVLIRGDLDDWPFTAHQGRFDALAHLSEVVLNYGEDWPHAEKISATAQFTDNGLSVEAAHAQTLGNTVTHAVMRIPDWANGVMTLAVQGTGSGASLLDFVRNSPVGHDSASILSQLAIGGNGKFAFTLVLPLGQPKPFTLDGTLQLSNADVVAKAWKLQLQNVTGPLHFDAKGFRADGLKAIYHGTPGVLSIAAAGDVANPAHQLEASLSAPFTAQALLQDYPALAGLAKIARGSANFRIGINVAAEANADNATKTLVVQSDLRGVALDLPAPLDKPASTTLPMTLQLGMPLTGNTLDLALGDLLRARGRLPDDTLHKPAALAIAFGNTAPTSLPASGMVVEGHARRLDLGGWAQLAGAGDHNTGVSPASGAATSVLPPLVSAQISADDARAFGKSLGALSLRYTPQAGEHMLTLDGARIAGTLTLPTANLVQRGITAQLQRLYWPGDESNKAASSATAAQPTPDALSGVAPGTLPPLHLSIGDLRLGDAKLGEAHFESTPTAAGMRVARMDTQSKDVQIRAHGHWNGNAQSSRSQFVIDIRSDNLGRMLGAFGFAGLIAGGDNTRASIEGVWPGAPTAFALANIDGDMKVDVGKGSIVEVKPGMGRLFGLFSIAQLPRRLLLDFGDVFKSGFSFNSITGAFALADGNAFTDNLDVKGPAAEIHIRGRTGLRAKDYDQTVTVAPHTSGALAVVGAVLGGPVGAAAGLALGRGLSRATGARYRITGSWDKPVITTISKTVPPAPAQSAASQAVSASSTP